MWSRTSDNWKTKPGLWDTVNCRHIFPSDNEYDIPLIRKPTLEELPTLPSCLIPYNLRVRSAAGYTDAAMHFFMDDYRFELCWSKPSVTLSRVKRAWLALTPDFSLYADYPKAVQIWNTYRNRWCGAFWQSEGLVVIPTIAWSTPDSYDYCFYGVEQESPVSISSQGLKYNSDSYKLFLDGFEAMIENINPRFVLCYGKLDEEVLKRFPDTIIKCYPTYWENLRKARKQGMDQDFYNGEPEAHGVEHNEGILEQL